MDVAETRMTNEGILSFSKINSKIQNDSPKFIIVDAIPDILFHNILRHINRSEF